MIQIIINLDNISLDNQWNARIAVVYINLLNTQHFTNFISQTKIISIQQICWTLSIAFEVCRSLYQLFQLDDDNKFHNWSLVHKTWIISQHYFAELLCESMIMLVLVMISFMKNAQSHLKCFSAILSRGFQKQHNLKYNMTSANDGIWQGWGSSSSKKWVLSHMHKALSQLWLQTRIMVTLIFFSHLKQTTV